MASFGSWTVMDDLSSIKSGIVLSAQDDIFYISNLNLKKSIEVPIEDFLLDSFKYRNEILCTLLYKVNALGERKNLYLDSKAYNLIDQICESNRLVY